MLRSALTVLSLAALCCPAVGRAGEQRVLVVGVRQAEQVSGPLTEAVVRRLRRMGERVVLTQALPCAVAEGRLEAACVRREARLRGAALVLLGAVERSGGDWDLSLRLLGGDGAPRGAERRGCHGCEREGLEDALADMAGQLVEQPDAAPATVAAPQPGDAALTLRRDVTFEEAPRYWQPWRVGVFAAAATLLSGSLIVAGVLQSRHGQLYPQDPRYQYDFTPQLAIGYTAAALGAAGVVVALSLPRRRP